MEESRLRTTPEALKWRFSSQWPLCVATKCTARSFHSKAPEHLPEELVVALGPILEMVGSLTERIRVYERQLEIISRAQGTSALYSTAVTGEHTRPEGRCPLQLPIIAC
jgi:hypothetical protein